MSIKNVKCRACGKVFQADDQLNRAFCMYCGTENHLVPLTGSGSPYDLAEDPITRREQLQHLAAGDGPDAAMARDRLLFWPARFFKVSRREERYGDKFLELITTVLFYSHNYPGTRNMKRARKDVERFFARPELRQALAEAAGPRQALLLEFHDAAEVYLRACRDDRHYGSRLFDIVKLKEEEVAAKAAEDVAVHMMHYLVALGLPEQSDLLVMALHRAWPVIFDKTPGLLDEAIAELPDDIRAAIYRLTAHDTELQEEKT